MNISRIISNILGIFAAISCLLMLWAMTVGNMETITVFVETTPAELFMYSMPSCMVLTVLFIVTQNRADKYDRLKNIAKNYKGRI